MGRTFIRQDAQIRNSVTYDDTVAAGSALETAPTSIEGDLNSIRSQAKRFLYADNAGDWFADINTPSALDAGTKRGITNLNTDLHDLERKRVLVAVDKYLTDVTVPASVQATGTFTSAGAFSDGETVTIGGQTYTFKSPFVNAANNIDASGTTAQTHENLRRAINGDGVAGTNYGTGTAVNTSVTAADTASTNVLTAILGGTVGNAIATTETCANASFGGATLSGGAGDIKILTLGELPSNTTAAVGAVTTRGTVAAYNSSFGNHSLAEVAGSSAITPKNLCNIVDATTHDPILVGGRVVYALFQTETATDGHTMTGTTPVRAQLAFVRLNSAGTDLEACPASGIAGEVIHYSAPERKALEDLNEQDFLRGAVTDIAAATTVTRQEGYNNQGTTPVDVTTHSYLDLEGAGLQWIIRDDTEANLLRVLEGSAGGTSEVQLGAAVDVFNVDAVVNDFAEGARFDSAGQRINIGETAGLIESTGANDLRILGAGEMYLDDGNQAGSSWAQTSGIKLSDTTAEWSAFETAFGEVSLLNAIVAAYNASTRTRADAAVTTNISANTLIEGPNGPGSANIDVDLVDYQGKTFVSDVEIFINGELMRNGANAAANHDVYPSAVAGEQQYGCFYCEFALVASPGNPDQITMFVN